VWNKLAAVTEGVTGSIADLTGTAGVADATGAAGKGGVPGAS
jgi:hypothetical protein